MPQTPKHQDPTDADKEDVGRRIKQARERHRWTLDERKRPANTP